jgi:hypothetical protein
MGQLIKSYLEPVVKVKLLVNGMLLFVPDIFTWYKLFSCSGSLGITNASFDLRCCASSFELVFVGNNLIGNELLTCVMLALEITRVFPILATIMTG